MADQSRPTTGNRNSATVYPYVSAPPNAPHNHIQPTYALKRSIIASLSRLIRYILCIGVLIVLIIWLLWLIFFIFAPKFRLETLTISNVHRPLADYLISGDLEARFILHNPNSKISLHYHQIEAAVLYKYKLIAKPSKVAPPFVQGPKNETAIRAIFTDFTGHIVDLDGFNGEATDGHLLINLDFMVMAVYKFSSAWGGGLWNFKVYCPHLLLDVSLKSNDGTLIDGWENCMTAY